VISDDLISVFHRDVCNFGFATHLFGNEIKALSASSAEAALAGGLPCRARGASFRISPTAPTELMLSDEPVSTLTQDFHTRLDNLLRTLVHAKPHFVRCIRPNEHDSLTEFDRNLVVEQIRSLQILETVNLMSGGFPHRMRFKAFNARFKSIVRPTRALIGMDEKAVNDCETILDCYSHNLKELAASASLPRNTSWAHGRKHVFLSEGARQQLERMREERRNNAATIVQKTWKGWHARRKFFAIFGPQVIRKSIMKPSAVPAPLAAGFNPIGVSRMSSSTSRMSTRSVRPRPQPLIGTPPPEVMQQPQTDRADFKVIQQTCALFGLDLVSWSCL
jgi:dachs protein